jgi:hypothetical protein
MVFAISAVLESTASGKNPLGFLPWACGATVARLHGMQEAGGSKAFVGTLFRFGEKSVPFCRKAKRGRKFAGYRRQSPRVHLFFLAS